MAEMVHVPPLLYHQTVTVTLYGPDGQSTAGDNGPHVLFAETMTS